MDDVGCLLPWHDADVSVERVGDGLEGVETHRVFALLYSADVVTLIARPVGEVLLRHALCFAEVSNALAYPLSLFFFAHCS
jgi:hypothetical protein